MLLVNIQVVYTVNKVAYMKHYFTTCCGIYETETITSCQYMENNTTHYYRNKDEGENINAYG